MIKTQSVVIDGDTYELTQLPAMRAMKLFARIGGVLGPALAQAAPAASAKGVLGMDIGLLGGAIESLAAKLTPEELEVITKDLLWSLRKNGKDCTGSFDVEMQGKIMTVFALLRFAFEVNYGDFTDALRRLRPNPPAVVPAPSP